MIWLLSFLPTSFVGLIIHLITLAGLAGLLVAFFMNALPLAGLQRNILKIISLILLIVGIFYEGVLYNQKVWEEKVAVLEEKLKLAEEKAKNNNKEIKIKYVTKVKRVKETQYVVQEKIKEVEKVIDAKCEITPESVNILNEAARNPNK